MPPTAPPDIVLFAPGWNPRALLRAQLLEEGFTVLATDAWQTMRRYLRPGQKPRLAIVDLQDLDNPMEVLRDLQILMDPNRVLVVTALGTVAAAKVEALGFRVAERPIALGDLVAAATRAIRERQSTQR